MTNTTFRARRQLLAAAALTALAPLRAHAQTFPSKPMRVVAAGPAGATADLVARLITAPLA